MKRATLSAVWTSTHKKDWNTCNFMCFSVARSGKANCDGRRVEHLVLRRHEKSGLFVCACQTKGLSVSPEACLTCVFIFYIVQGRRWPGLHRNDQSLAELWVGLLRFFSVDFNWKDYVICIRQLKPLTRFEKLWNGTGFCIEGAAFFLTFLSHPLSVKFSQKKRAVQPKQHVGTLCVLPFQILLT